jgi:alkanesulfonate monooxygenase SsuD/methylene tetrahydromethanopterin reductase-like flavin-dependent oxidoreductase (luciferase family)
VNIGVVFPQTEIGADTGAVRAYAQQVEELGFAHILAYDHVLGADPAVHQGWNGPYDIRTTFHEPLVLFGYLAALTSLELVPGIIILPQRQTALVAKQAAEVDLLTGGRFRLGVGLGWNAVEYEALGKNFGDRGRRLTEQVALLRQLWTEESVTFAGTYVRAGQLADGWFPQVPPGPRLDEARGVVEQAAVAAGRDPAQIGMEGRVSWGEGGAEKLVDHVGRWRGAGASHVSINTMGAGLGSVHGHLEALAAAAGALGLGGR